MDVKQQQQKNNTPEPMNIGAFLVAARESRDLSIEDIASQMKLTLAVITQIEANQFEQDIPLIFIRGYVRSYAQIVATDVESICAEFDRQTNDKGELIQKIQVVSSFNTSRKEINSSSFWFKLLTYLIVISLMGFAGWEAWKRFAPGVSADPQKLNEIQLNTVKINVQPTKMEISNNILPEVDAETDANEGTLPVIEGIDDVSTKNTIISQGTIRNEQVEVERTTELEFPEINKINVEPIAEQSENQPVSEPTVLISGPIVSANLVFSADCWVKITDANGEILAIGLKHDGKVMPLKGVAPLSVILGAPAAVSLTFQGESFDLSHFSAGRTAQFVLE